MRSISSLLYLITLQVRGKMRRTMRRLRHPKRAILTLIASSILVLWFGQELRLVLASTDRPPIASETLVYFAPLAMLAILALKVSPIMIRRDLLGVSLRGAEVYLLKAGPFRHHTIRIYKIAGHFASIVVTALFASLFLWPDVDLWLAGYLCALTGMVSIYLIYLMCAVSANYVSQKIYDRLRCAIVVASGCLMVHCLQAGMRADAIGPAGLVGIVRGTVGAAAALTQTLLGHILLAPLHVSAMLLRCSSFWPELLFHCLIAIAANVALGIVMVRWESYLIARTERRERETFALSRHAPVAHVSASRRSRRPTLIAPLPWLRGIGPIVWRQLCAVRCQLPGIGLIGVVTCFVTWAILTQTANPASQQDFSAWLLLTFFTSLFLPNLLPYDFRTDYGSINLLKTLPIPSASVAIGQVVVPVVITLCMQMLILAVWCTTRPGAPWSLWIGPAYLLPVNVSIFALENVVFLLYPFHPNEFGFHATAGRVLKGVARLILFAAAAFAAILFAQLTLIVVSWSVEHDMMTWWVRLAIQLWWMVGSWSALAMCALVLLRILVWVYDRFDSAADSPLKAA